MKQEKSWDEFEKYSVKVTTRFLKEFPERATRNCETEQKQIKNIRQAFDKEIKPNKRTTRPDYLVSEILEMVFGHDNSQRDEIQDNYIEQKQSEAMIGQLLERYIALRGKDYGWAFTGECIKSVDFIKNEARNWVTLQVKTSSHTEHYYSTSVRDGTEIQKWVRRNAPKGTYLWDSFPDKELSKELSEEGFFEFVRDYFHN